MSIKDTITTTKYVCVYVCLHDMNRYINLYLYEFDSSECGKEEWEENLCTLLCKLLIHREGETNKKELNILLHVWILGTNGTIEFCFYRQIIFVTNKVESRKFVSFVYFFKGFLANLNKFCLK